MSSSIGGSKCSGPSPAKPRKRCKGATDQFGIQVFDDEDQLRPAVAVRPPLKMGRRMHKALYTIDGYRPRFPAQRQQPFDTQYPGAVPVEQHRQPDAEAAPVDRLLDNDREGAGLGVRDCPIRLADGLDPKNPAIWNPGLRFRSGRTLRQRWKDEDKRLAPRPPDREIPPIRAKLAFPVGKEEEIDRVDLVKEPV